MPGMGTLCPSPAPMSSGFMGSMKPQKPGEFYPGLVSIHGPPESEHPHPLPPCSGIWAWASPGRDRGGGRGWALSRGQTRLASKAGGGGDPLPRLPPALKGFTFKHCPAPHFLPQDMVMGTDWEPGQVRAAGPRASGGEEGAGTLEVGATGKLNVGAGGSGEA